MTFSSVTQALTCEARVTTSGHILDLRTKEKIAQDSENSGTSAGWEMRGFTATSAAGLSIGSGMYSSSSTVRWHACYW
jgi:hypothetical protein